MKWNYIFLNIWLVKVSYNGRFSQSLLIAFQKVQTWAPIVPTDLKKTLGEKILVTIYVLIRVVTSVPTSYPCGINKGVQIACTTMFSCGGI